MRRRLLINLVVVLIAAVLAAVAWLDAHRDGDPSRLTALEADAVEVIHLQRRGRDDVRMERRAEGWWLSDPVEARASDFHVRQVLALAELRSEAQYSTREVDPDEAGLAPPRVHIALNGTGIRLGAEDPVDELRYAMVGERVHLVRDRVMPLVRGPWWNFLDRRVLSDARAPAALVTEGLELRREEAGWRVVRGDLDRAGAEALMAAWRDLEALVVRPLETVPDSSVPDARVTFADGGARRFVAGQVDGEVRLVDIDAQRAYVLNEDVRRYLLTGKGTD